MRADTDDEEEPRLGDLGLHTPAARSRFIRIIARVLAREALADIVGSRHD